MKAKLSIGALISGGGTNLQAILDACRQGTIAGRVVAVGTDNPRAAGLARAGKLGIDTFVVDYGRTIRDYRANPGEACLPGDFDGVRLAARQNLVQGDAEKVRAFLESRALAEAQLLAALAPFAPDLLVLAGFMRTLTPYFIDHFNRAATVPRIMNIHPALLPAFPGVDGYGDTFRYGCKVAGCTVHFVDYGEDTGPIIAQRAFAVEPGDSLNDVRRKGLTQEWDLYPRCIQLYAQGRLSVVSADPPDSGRPRVRIDPPPK